MEGPNDSRIVHHTLVVSRLERSVQFYTKALRFKLMKDYRNEQSSTGEAKNCIDLSLAPGKQTVLRLVESENTLAQYSPSKHDVYWKIGITVTDLVGVCDELKTKQIAVSEPSQFRDIGFLCHLKDPDGFTIELLQKTFKDEDSEPKTTSASSNAPDFQFAHISLRCKDPKASMEYYTSLGMRLLGKMAVTPYKFTLFFLGYSSESPPNPDLEAVENRSWLWHRPYTLIELCHNWGTEDDEDFKYKLPREGEELAFREIGLTETTGTGDRDPDGVCCRHVC